MEHYILSTKHTHKKDQVFTFWRHGSRGYCWRIDWAGFYKIPEEQAVKSDQNTERYHGAIYIHKNIIEPLLVTATFEGQQVKVLPNSPGVRSRLKIAYSELKSLGRTGIGFKFN